MKKLLKKYGKYIDDIYKSDEFNGDLDYWCELADDYETSEGLSTIHDTLKHIEWELEEISKRYK